MRYVVLAFALSLFVYNAEAQTYYVKNGGNDNLDGTSDTTAWATIGKVNSAVRGTSDKVYFRCGSKWTSEALRVVWSGISSNKGKVGAYDVQNGKIVFSSCANKPVVDGANQVPGDAYTGIIHVTGSYVDIEYLRLINSKGMGVRVMNASNDDITGVETEYTYMSGIQYYQSSYGVISDTKIREATRLFLTGTVNNGGWPSNLGTINSNHITIRNSIVYDSYGEGIGIFKNSNNNVVENNVVVANRSAGIYIDRGQSNIIRKNIVYGTTNTAYHRSSGVVGPGIAINDENGTSGNLSQGNLIYDNLVTFCGTGISIWTRDPNASFKNSGIYNNTFVDNNSQIEISDGPFSNSYIRNNIFFSQSSGTVDYKGPTNTPGLTWDHNHWTSPPSGNLAGSGDVNGNPNLTKSSGWRAIAAFGDIGANDFKLKKGSTASSHGVLVKDAEYDFFGNLRESNNVDMGAIQINSLVGTPVVPTGLAITKQ